MQDSPQQPIDERIKSAQRKGIGVYLFSGLITVLLLLGFALWLFFVKGFALVIGPNDAQLSARVNVTSGLAWVSETRIYTLGGDVSLAVSADTFQTANIDVTSQSPSTISIVLLPQPATINARATSITEGFSEYSEETQWYVNASLVHVGESLRHETPPGEYVLSVRNPYYREQTIPLSLQRAEEVNIAAEFETVQGRISIDSLPQGVDVFIDGVAQGQTPVVFEASGGKYAVKLVSDKFQQVDETVAVLAGFLKPSRRYQLAPKQAELVISVSPSEGLLLVNSVEYPVGRIQLDAHKTHTISYTKAGYTPFNKTVNVNIAAPQDLKISLQALYSEVSIKSNVPAQIKLNGKAVGKAPYQDILRSVQHTLEASYPGYRTQRKNFVAKDNKPTQVLVNLLTEFDARRAEGKPLFASTLGINMKAFKGNEFTMGSPANESGRRRNEHQLDIDFSRRFWVSEKEITHDQFAAQFVAGSQKKSSNGKAPITGISWLQAAEYCNWLSVQEGLPIFYRFQNGRYLGVNVESRGYRLPTEAEWEWLAKKSKRATSTIYVWGNQETLRNNAGNFADKQRASKQVIILSDYTDKHPDVAEVGSYSADRNGLYDMAGNVSEWVHDKYTNSLPDTSQTHIDYLGSNTGDAWVIKGGNYETGRMRELRAAYREFGASGKATLGFRIARYDN